MKKSDLYKLTVVIISAACFCAIFFAMSLIFTTENAISNAMNSLLQPQEKSKLVFSIASTIAVPFIMIITYGRISLAVDKWLSKIFSKASYGN